MFFSTVHVTLDLDIREHSFLILIDNHFCKSPTSNRKIRLLSLISTYKFSFTMLVKKQLYGS